MVAINARRVDWGPDRYRFIAFLRRAPSLGTDAQENAACQEVFDGNWIDSHQGECAETRREELSWEKTFAHFLPTPQLHVNSLNPPDPRSRERPELKED
jgi:hypothetical protein